MGQKSTKVTIYFPPEEYQFDAKLYVAIKRGISPSLESVLQRNAIGMKREDYIDFLRAKGKTLNSTNQIIDFSYKD